MIFSGFADEAADSIEHQILATKALGWRNIELRKAGGQFAHDVSEAEFDRIAGCLSDAGVGVHCLGSRIANNGRIDQADEPSLDQARRAIPRMRRLGTKLVRIMSWSVDVSQPPAQRLGAQRIARLRELAAMFADAGMTMVHENCGNYGGQGWRWSLELLEAVPGLKLVFDPGNCIKDHDVDAAPLPDGSLPNQSAWEFYRRVRDHIVHFHVKDARHASDGSFRWCFPGEGEAHVEQIIRDLLLRGYAGAFSIEPHLGIGLHHGIPAAEARLRTYIEYGHRTEALIAAIRGRLVADGCAIDGYAPAAERDR